MDIHQTEQDHRGSFYIKEGFEVLAQMTYSLSPDLMIIDHTEVDEKLKGQKIGNKLLEAATSYARNRQWKVLPLCPFAKMMMDRDPEAYADIRK